MGVTRWIPEVRSVCPASVIMVVGNKIDLRDQAFDKSGFISWQMGQEGAKHMRCDYSECSALTREGLK